MKKVLFICSQNKIRSATAEKIFSEYDHLEVDSAGLNNDAVKPLSPEQVRWADVIFVMESNHKNKLRKKFKEHLNRQSVISLEIPDEYEFMGEDLIWVLKRKLGKFLGIEFSEDAKTN